MGSERSRAEQKGGFVVGMRDGTRVDHAAIIDANAGILVDSEESDVLLLSARNLHHCGGSSTRKLGTQEVSLVERIEMKRAVDREYTEVVDVIDVDALPLLKLPKTT